MYTWHGCVPFAEESKVIIVTLMILSTITSLGQPHPYNKSRRLTAKAILDARLLYPDSSLADLYDEVAMPPELRKAHQNNDRTVMQAYGFSVKDMTESMCVAELMKLYQEKLNDN